MSESAARNYPDGGIYLVRSPFRSWHFVGISGFGLVLVSMVAYLIHRHGDAMPGTFAWTLAVWIGLQTFIQWLRALSYYSRIRELYKAEAREGLTADSPLEKALRIASGGMAELLFNSFLITLIALFMIMKLLTHIDGIKW